MTTPDVDLGVDAPSDTTSTKSHRPVWQKVGAVLTIVIVLTLIVTRILLIHEVDRAANQIAPSAPVVPTAPAAGSTQTTAPQPSSNVAPVLPTESASDSAQKVTGYMVGIYVNCYVWSDINKDEAYMAHFFSGGSSNVNYQKSVTYLQGGDRISSQLPPPYTINQITPIDATSFTVDVTITENTAPDHRSFTFAWNGSTNEWESTQDESLN